MQGVLDSSAEVVRYISRERGPNRNRCLAAPACRRRSAPPQGRPRRGCHNDPENSPQHPRAMKAQAMKGIRWVGRAAPARPSVTTLENGRSQKTHAANPPARH